MHPRALAIWILRFIEKILHSLYGYDIFISYAHKDGKQYAKVLRDTLAGPTYGFDVHLDQYELYASDEIGPLLKLRIKNSRMLVVLARPEALENSKWVRDEVAETLKRGRSPVVVEINRSLANVSPKPGFLSSLIGSADTERMRLFDTVAGLPGFPNDGEPSSDVVEDIAKSFGSRRVRSRRAIIVASFAAFAVAIASTAVALGFISDERRRLVNEISLRLTTPKAMDREAQTMTAAECSRVRAVDNAPMRPYPQLTGVEPARTPKKLAIDCQTNTKTAGLSDDDLLMKHLDPGIRWMFADAGAKTTYVRARMTDDPLRSTWFTSKRIAPYEAAMIAQSHSLDFQCAALKLGRKKVNELICGMEPPGNDPSEWPQHYP